MEKVQYWSRGLSVSSGGPIYRRGRATVESGRRGFGSRWVRPWVRPAGPSWLVSFSMGPGAAAASRPPGSGAAATSRPPGSPGGGGTSGATGGAAAAGRAWGMRGGDDRVEGLGVVGPDYQAIWDTRARLASLILGDLQAAWQGPYTFPRIRRGWIFH